MRPSVTLLLAILLAILAVAQCALAQSECYEDVIVTHTNIEFVDGTYSFAGMINGRPSFRQSYQISQYCGVTGRIAYSAAGYWYLEVSGSPACSSCDGNGYAFYRAMCGADSTTPPTDCGWFRTPGYQQTCWEGQNYADIEGGTQCVPTDYPAIILVKDAAHETYNVGDEIAYTFTVTNTGTMSLTDVVATDQTLQVVVPLQQTTLDPGESTIGTLVYTVLQSDVVDGQFTNIASVIGIAPDLTEVSDSADETVTVHEAPAIELQKQASNGPFEVGDIVSFTFAVSNTGSVTLYDVALYDETLGQSVPLGTTTLEPGESTSGTLEYAITQDDVEAGEVANEASVQAATASGTPVTDSATISIGLTRSPRLDLEKSSEGGIFYEGELATFSFTLTNTGNVTLENLSLTDHVLGETVGFSVSTLTPGSWATASIGYTVTAADAAAGLFSNDATAEAWTTYGERVLADDDATILCAIQREEVELPEEVQIAVWLEPSSVGDSETFSGSSGRRPLSATRCQGEAITITVSVLDEEGIPITNVPVYGTLFEIAENQGDEQGSDVETVRGTCLDGEYALAFGTTALEAGLVDVRAWISGHDEWWFRIALIACGDNVDDDLVSDFIDRCPETPGIATNAGCPRGDLDFSGIPDHLECLGEILAEEAYPVRLVVETSSDWTSISLENGKLLLTSIEREGSPIRGYTGLLDLLITKPCCTANLVKLTYDAYVFDTTGSELAWTIAKGGWGRASLGIYAYPDASAPDSASPLIVEYANTRTTDPDETVPPRTFTQPLSGLSEIVEPISLEASCDAPDVEPLMLALFSAGFATMDGVHGEWVGWRQGRTNYGALNAPQGGPYDSLDEALLRNQIQLALQAGIDAFVCLWPGPGSIEDQVVAMLLDLATESDFQIGFYIEDQFIGRGDDLRYLHERYSDHEAILRMGALPVLIFERNMQRSVDIARDLRELSVEGIEFFAVLDGIDLQKAGTLDGVSINTLRMERGEAFDLLAIPEKMARAALHAEALGEIYVATVHPGGLGRLPNGDQFIVERNETNTYRMLWDSALACDPDWILLRSFNLWLEGTEIEPSEQYGSTYLALTRQFAEEWKASH